MGRSKSNPVQRRMPAHEPSPDENSWLGRRASGYSPESLLQRELLDEGNQRNAQRQLFADNAGTEDDPADDIGDAPESDSDDSQDVIVSAAPRKLQSPFRKKKGKRKAVSFSDSLTEEIAPPEIILSRDSVNTSLTILKYNPRETTPDDDSDSSTKFLLRKLLLPNTRIVYDDDATMDAKLPSSFLVNTSLGVSDLWRHYQLPGMGESLADIVSCLKETLIQVEIRPTRDVVTLHVYLTNLAMQTCHASNIPVTLNSRQSKQRQRADQLRVVIASLFSELSPRPPASTAPDIAARQVYKVVDNVQLQAWMAKKAKQQPHGRRRREFPGLIPTLRPYQEAAVEWMLEREQQPVESREWELAWVVLDDCGNGQCTFLPDYNRSSLNCHSTALLFYNQFTGWLASSYEEARSMTVGDALVFIKGGILSDEMGCGKSVEVLACILANRKPVDEIAKRENSTLPVPAGAVVDGDSESMTASTEVVSFASGADDHQKVGYVGDLDDFGDAEDSSDQDSFADHMHQGGSATCALVTNAVPVTPDKPLEARYSVREEWVDEDELGSCICGKIISFEQSEGQAVVICSSCREPMHKECAPPGVGDYTGSNPHFKCRQRFTNKTIHCATCHSRHCPSCMASNNVLVESGATLIVIPPAILDQWRHELSRHTSHAHGLNILVYEGVKASQLSRSPGVSVQALHPSVLAKADVVLMTFDSLMSDLGHSDDNRFVTADADAHLRRRKRYRVVASPLMGIHWWRIILDEAQRVETPTAGSARMALKLSSCNKWAVTGTPLGRGKMNDLYGLLLFLRLDPFTVKQMFNKCFQQDSCLLNSRIRHLLNTILWRSTKALPLVAQQLGLLEQVEKKVILRFSSVEKHFYNQQLQEAISIVGDLGSEARKGKKRKAIQLEVANRLYRLRAACCHPQVGAGGISHQKRLRAAADKALNSVCRRVMTMEEILITFIEDARLKCEEAQRLVIMHRNAVAAISRLKISAKQRGVQIPETELQLLTTSRDLYLDALALVKGNSLPTLILGEALLSGSVGFCSASCNMKNGAGSLAWKLVGQVPAELCATIEFPETARKIIQLRLLSMASVPVEILSDTSDDFSWKVLHPRKCTLQVQVDSAGGEFVDVACLFLPLPSDDPASHGEQWIFEAGFMTNKSKSWRIVIDSFHAHTLSEQCLSNLQGFGVFAGLRVELYEANIDNDPIQRLHALSNAIISCQSLMDLDGRMDNSMGSRTCKGQQALISSLHSEAELIERLYTKRARAVHAEAKKRLGKISEERIQKETTLFSCSAGPSRRPLDCWDDAWWRDFLSALHIYGSEEQKNNVLAKLGEELHIYTEGSNQSLDVRGVQKFPPFHNVHGFMTALELRIQSIRSGIGGKKGGSRKLSTESTCLRRKTEPGAVDGAVLFEFRSTRFKVTPGLHEACMRDVSALSDHPSRLEILENSNCSVCKVDWFKTGPKCRHCYLGSVLEDLTPDKITENVLRVLGDIVRSSVGASILNEHGDPNQVAERTKGFFDLLEAQKREKVAAYRMWRVHLDLLNDLDELEQVKTPIRLSDEAEDLTQLTEDEKNAVVQPVEIHHRFHDHAAKEAMAQGDLRRAQEKLRYLQTLVCGQSEEIDCPICLNPFIERAVLRCGHSMCQKCLDDFRVYSKGHLIACPKKCTLKTDPQDILLASNESKKDGTLSSREVNGSYGTKVTYLLSDILDIRDQGDKGVVFSQWEDMLDIVQSALAQNGVGFVRADSRKTISDSVAQFRMPSVTILLLNVKNGAEGLTLLEATHCFMVEPILNAGLDAQAISRIHRIGQRRRTFVHRYLIEGTIEAKIDKIREEHQADNDALEEALNEGRKSVIGAGGIDGGFKSQDEVMQLLSLDT